MPWNDQPGEDPKGSPHNPWGPRPKNPASSGNGDRGGTSGKSPDSDGQNPWARPGSDRPRNDRPHQDGPHSDSRAGGREGGSRLDDLMRQAQDRFGRSGGGGGRGPGSFDPSQFLRGMGLPAIGAIALLGWLATGVFVVDSGEIAVVQTFGRYDSLRSSGLHVRLPYPIQTTRIVNIQRPNREDLGAGQGSGDTGLMLTGDEAVVNIGFSVFWRVRDPKEFLFNVRNPQEAVKSAADSAMREVVGKRQLEPIITGERDLVASETRASTQSILDSYKAGIEITQVNLTVAGPPEKVVAAFREVANAGQEAQANINQAETYRNQIVPEARGEAAKMLQEAEGYRERVIRDATGEASRFDAIYAQYRLAPEVTRRRMYLETLERIYAATDKIILDERAGGAVPYLPLTSLKSTTTPGEGR